MSNPINVFKIEVVTQENNIPFKDTYFIGVPLGGDLVKHSQQLLSANGLVSVLQFIYADEAAFNEYPVLHNFNECSYMLIKRRLYLWC